MKQVTLEQFIAKQREIVTSILALVKEGKVAEVAALLTTLTTLLYDMDHMDEME